jgi:hypothetical protein
MLQSLRALKALLDTPSVDRVAELRGHRDKLEAYRAASVVALQNMVEVLANNPLGRGNTAKIERLLGTPLLTALQREKLLDALAAAEKEAVSKLLAFKVIRGPTTRPPDRTLDQLSLELELARLVGTRSAGADSAETSRSTSDAIDAAETALQRASTSGRSRAESIREFGTAMKRFYLSLPATIQSSRITQELEPLQSRERLLRAIDARDVVAVRTTIETQQDPIETIRQSQLFNILAWHQERFDRLRQLSAPAEREELFQAAIICNRLARRIPDQPELQPPSSFQSVASMDPSPPERLRLNRPEPFRVRLSPIQRQDVTKLTLVLTFDPKQVEVTAPATERVSTDVGSLRTEIDLRPDEPRTVEFAISAKQESDDAAVVTAQLLVGGRLETEQAFKLSMPLPQLVDLKVSGPNLTVSQIKRTYTLRPFPGHSTPFQFELTARKPCEVRVQMRALADPVRESDRQRAEQTGQVPAGSDLDFKFESEFVALDENPVKLPFRSEAEKGGPAVSHGLVCILDEKATKRRIFYWLDVVPLHPSEYLKVEFPRLEPSGQDTEVKIQFKAAGTLFPPGGSEVELELLKEEMPRGKKASAKLDDAQATDFVSVKLDPDRRRSLLARLHVDGYPRAFVYEMDVTQNRPISRRMREIRLFTPAKIYAPRPSIPVTIFVDAPNAFRDPETRIELAWSSRAPRPGAGTPTKRFFTERAVSSAIEEGKEDGTLVIKVEATDFEYPIPTAGIENDQLEFVARLVERDRPDLVSERLQVVIDGTAPIFASFEVPERIEVGQPVKIAARVTDESPIEKVQFALCDRFDPAKFEDPAKFAELPIQKDGVFDQDRGLYIAQLTTEKLEAGEAGLRYTIVARSRNEYLDKWAMETKQVMIVPKSAKTADRMTGEIEGTVMLYDKINPGALVTIAAKDPATIAKVPTAIAPAAADKDGKFKFENLIPGTYTIKATTKAGNSTYRLPRPLDVVVQAGVTQKVKLELKL